MNNTINKLPNGDFEVVRDDEMWKIFAIQYKPHYKYFPQGKVWYCKETEMVFDPLAKKQHYKGKPYAY